VCGAARVDSPPMPPRQTQQLWFPSFFLMRNFMRYEELMRFYHIVAFKQLYCCAKNRRGASSSCGPVKVEDGSRGGAKRGQAGASGGASGGVNSTKLRD
jgi:hypothetical protein